MATISQAEARAAGLTEDNLSIVEAAQAFAAEMASGDVIVRGSPSQAGTIPNSSWYRPEVTELAEEITPERVQQIFTGARAGNSAAVMDVIYLSAMMDPERQPEAYAALSSVAGELTILNANGVITLNDIQANILGDIAPAGVQPVVTPDVAVEAAPLISNDYMSYFEARQARLQNDAEISQGVSVYQNPDVVIKTGTSNYTQAEFDTVLELARSGNDMAFTDLMLISTGMRYGGEINQSAMDQIQNTYTEILTAHEAGEIALSDSSLGVVQNELDRINGVVPEGVLSASQVAFQERQARIAQDNDIVTQFDPTYLNPDIAIVTGDLGNYTNAEIAGIIERAKTGDNEAIMEANTILAVLGGEPDIPVGPTTDLVVAMGAVLQANENGEPGFDLDPERITAIEASIAVIYQESEVSTVISQMDPSDAYGVEYLQTNLANGNMTASLETIAPQTIDGTPIILENGEPLLHQVTGEVMTREAIAAGLMEMSEGDTDLPLDNYQTGLQYLNPAYAEFFEATEETAGVWNNSIRTELNVAFNEDPATLQQFIALADDPEGLRLLTDRIRSEQGATDLTQALADITDRRGLGETEPAPVVDGIINNQREIEAGVAPSSPAEDFTPFEPVEIQEAPNQPVIPERDETPTIQQDPVIVAEQDITLVNTVPVITHSFNVSASLEGLQTLTNGVANDDIEYLQDLIEEARIAGVDPALIQQIEDQINGNMAQFVTTQSAVAMQAAYSDSAIAGMRDGTYSLEDHQNALKAAFEQATNGIVEDRVGLRDDIAASPAAQAAAERLIAQANAIAQGTTQSANVFENRTVSFAPSVGA